jgi:DNA-binding NtrC family response regulator
MARVVVIDDVTHTPATIGHLLNSGHQIIPFPRGTLSVDFVRENFPDLVIMSLDVSDVDGLDLVSRLARQADAVPVVCLRGSGDPRRIVAAVRAGAFDVMVRPLRAEILRECCLRALATRAKLTDQVGVESTLREIVGVSPAMDHLRTVITRVARSDAPVLIAGESGVGKELVAKAVHRLSRRANDPFQTRNCGAIPEQLFESEMFGTERGAYTGAIQRPGAFEMADGGTLFLDEVGELVPANQVKLLRALENGRFHRVGGTAERRVDLRIVAATNRDLKCALANGEFRADLYYRLNVLQITIPPLRHRREDIPVLVQHFHDNIDEIADEKRFSVEALARLSDYDWPGNIRELRNVIHRAAVCAESTPVSGADIQFG